MQQKLQMNYSAKQDMMIDSLGAFCSVCREAGYELYPMDIVQAGDEFYAAMKRSTNGGGENSPVLIGEDDPYELFFAGLQEQLQ